MPIYEYRCNDCGCQTEFLQKLNDPVQTTCPDCGHESLTRLVSAAGFQLKGNGWYATDFKNGSSPAAKKESANASPPCQGGDGACPCAAS